MSTSSTSTYRPWMSLCSCPLVAPVAITQLTNNPIWALALEIHELCRLYSMSPHQQNNKVTISVDAKYK